MSQLENSQQDETQERREEPEPQTPEEKDQSLKREYERYLTENELNQLTDKKITIHEIEAKKIELKKQAELKLANLKKQIKDREVVSFSSYKSADETLQKELEEEKSPEKLEALIKRIEGKTKEEQEKANDESSEIDFKSPKLKPYKKQAQNLIKKYERHLGTKQTGKFEKWFLDELEKAPSIKNAKDLLYKLENNDVDGIKPRKLFYEQRIAPLMRKYGVAFDELSFLGIEGLSERKPAIMKIEEIEKRIEGLKNAGFYSFKCKKEIMQKMLKAPSENKLNQIFKTADQVLKEEANLFTSQTISILTKTKINIHGKDYQAMSQKSVDLFLADYQHNDIETRKKTIPNLEEIAKNEGKLLRELGKLYKDDKEGFFEAVKSFLLLSYQEKEQELKTHKTLIKNNNKETLRKSNKISDEMLKEIDDARTKKTISNKTAASFRKWARNPKHFTNNKGEIDLKKQERMKNNMTSTTPVFEREKRNLAAYKYRKEKRFSPLLEKYQKANPEISDSEIRDWEEEYNEGTYKERKTLYKKLKKSASEAKINKEKSTKFTGENLQKSTEKLKGMSLEGLMEKTDTLIQKEHYIEAGQQLWRWLSENRKTASAKQKTKIKLKINYINDLIAELGDGEETESRQQEAEKEAERLIDNEFKEETEELNVEELEIEGAEQAERRHKDITDARKRAEKESLTQFQEGSLGHDLAQDFYKQTRKTDILDETGTGAVIEERQVHKKTGELTSEEIQERRERLKTEQSKLDTHEGFTSHQLLDADGKKISSDEAIKTHERKKEKVIDEIGEKVEKNVGKKEKAKGNNVFDLAERVKKDRKIEEIFNRRTQEKIDKAA